MHIYTSRLYLTAFSLICFSLFFSGCKTIPPADHTDGSDICQLHGIQMEKKTVRIIRGFPNDRIDDESNAAAKSFPHGMDFFIGESIKVKGDPGKAIVFECSECVKARNQWYAEWKSFRTNDVGRQYGIK